MSKVAIVTDSSAYLPQEFVQRYDIAVPSLTIHWDGKSYFDGKDIQAAEFYERLANSKTIPTTSQVTVGQFLDVFKDALNQGKDVIYMGISRGLSATYDSAIQAAKELGNPSNLVIVDTQLVSMALSLMVLEVCRAAEQGADLKTLEQVALEAYPKIGVYFTVATLDYLHKGGRINSAKRLLGSALNLKPIMEIRNGKIELVESVISRKKSISRMLDLIEKQVAGKENIRIAPFHARCEEDLIAMEAEAVERFHPVEVIRSEVSPMIGSHTGPGTISMAYMAG